MNLLAVLSVIPVVAMAGPPGETLHLSLVTDQIAKPVYVISPPGDLERVFVVEQWDDNATGWIWLVDNGVLQSQAFFEMSPVATNNATGVLCVEFDPDFATNGIFYVFYTDAAGDVLISRFTVSADPDVADMGTEQLILTTAQPHHFHQGGWLGFGPDGYLYLSSGDGGPANDPDHRGQDTASLLGKLLRIDVSGDDFPGDASRNYAIPPTNPFVGVPTRDEIWALGVREPWRCSFDRETGDFYIADVGQESWEEVDVEPAGFAGGANYGWRCREGAHEFESDPECDGLTFADPIHEYPHGGNPANCSITGGYVYRGTAIPELQGRYFFADYCSSRIWSFCYDGGSMTDLVEHPIAIEEPPGIELERITSFGEDACGELYVCAHPGQVFKMIPSSPPADCNDNGIDDGCEINLGLVGDGDGDGIPDVCECPWDLDGDGAVDIVDLLALLAAWGPHPGGPPDFNGDGAVGLGDFLELLVNWGDCP